MPIRIAILHPTAAPWVARIFDGIQLYAKEQGDWHIFSMPASSYGAEKSTMSLRSMKGWKGDGIIMASNEVAELRYAKQLGIPAVNLAAGLRDLHGIPRVTVNNYEVGRLAAEHLLERGLTNLAFYGWEDLWYSEQRYLGFRERAAESGAECLALLRALNEDSQLSWSQRISIPAEWLASLPLPCGIFAVHDFRAQLLMEACYEAGLRIPNDIAVVSMDNNETICEHSVPALSSIARSSQQVGYEAAALLNRMIKGESELPQELLLPPTEVVLRESSDMMYCSDPLVRQAIEFMRKNLRENFNVEAIAGHLGISKRKLERRFSEAVNSSPRQYLIKLRIHHAQALMKLEPDRTVEDIAHACGFGTMPTFYTAFRRLTGLTPAKFNNTKTAAAKSQLK